MRRVAASLLSLVLLFSVWIPGAECEPAPSVSLARAVELAKRAYPVPDHLRVLENAFVPGDGSASFWHLNWRTPDWSESVQVSVNSQSGEVFQIQVNPRAPEILPGLSPLPAFPTLTPSQALLEAQKQARRLAGNRLQQTRLEGCPTAIANLASATVPLIYRFSFVRQVNQIPFPEDSIEVGIDGNTGNLTMYYLHWTEASFPAPAEHTDAGMAETAIMEKVPLALEYWRPWNPWPQGPVTPVLIYRPVTIFASVNALTGAFALSPSYLQRSCLAGDMAMYRPRPQPPAPPASPSPESGDRTGLITDEQAQAAVAALLGGNGEYLLTSAALTRDGPYAEQVCWTLTWQKGNPGNGACAYRTARVDAQTGEVVYFSRNYG
jgi:hypothetical protein